MAQSYSQAKKWKEAAALFERAMHHVERSTDEWQSVNNGPIQVSMGLTCLDKSLLSVMKSGLKILPYFVDFLVSSGKQIDISWIYSVSPKILI